MPRLDGVVPLEAVVGDVVGQEVVEALAVHVVPVLDVVLLGRDHRQVLLLLAAVLAKLDTWKKEKNCRFRPNFIFF